MEVSFLSQPFLVPLGRLFGENDMLSAISVFRWLTECHSRLHTIARTRETCTARRAVHGALSSLSLASDRRDIAVAAGERSGHATLVRVQHFHATRAADIPATPSHIGSPAKTKNSTRKSQTVMLRRLVVIASLLHAADGLTSLLADANATDGERKLESNMWCKFRQRFTRPFFPCPQPRHPADQMWTGSVSTAFRTARRDRAAEGSRRLTTRPSIRPCPAARRC